MPEVEVNPVDDNLDIRFHHIHMYVDALKPLAEYKKMEGALNQLSSRGRFDPFSGGMKFLDAGALPERIEEGKRIWAEIYPEGAADPEAYSSCNQDVVEQLIVGLGWRVTAEYVGAETRSLLVCSADALGVKFVISAIEQCVDMSAEEPYDHFRRRHIEAYFSAHGNRQGIAVLAFEVGAEGGGVQEVLNKYHEKHPKLNYSGVKRAPWNYHMQRHADSPSNKRPKTVSEAPGAYSYTDTRNVTLSQGGNQQLELGSLQVGEVYAYYNKDKSGADTGTVLRFIQRDGTYGPAAGFSNPEGVLPGFEGVAYQFDGTSIPAYSDHWVSNVIDRNGFLDTLNDTLGFTPKVDFNAGVVAAGEAVIESTVTGNTSKHLSTTTTEVLKNQTQVYLPINNAISPVGHVYGYLEEIGQGVQHIASRVEDLQGFIERVNNYRSITGRGFTFLNIPRSYYGRCSAELLVKEAGLGAKDADAAFAALVAAGICTKAGVTDLDVTDAAITKAVKSVKACGGAAASKVGAAVKLGRYNNLYTLLRDNVTEQDYLQIVRNKILVDIQGEDILYQIFTSCVLQRGATEEAPFLEFIQRVCADCRGLDGNCRTDKPIKPGCGGFGIRNFLTLFLSIELSKAMRECDDAAASGQTKNMEYAEKQISILTHQLDESNPVLTMISDAMTAEGACVEELAAIATDLSAAANKRRKVLNAEVEKQQAQKEAGNQKLQDVSQRHKDQMSAIREAHLK